MIVKPSRKVALPAQHEVISNDGVEAGDRFDLQIALGVASKPAPEAGVIHADKPMRGKQVGV